MNCIHILVVNNVAFTDLELVYIESRIDQMLSYFHITCTQNFQVKERRYKLGTNNVNKSSVILNSKVSVGDVDLSFSF